MIESHKYAHDFQKEWAQNHMVKYDNLKENIAKVISEIPKEKYENIFKGSYDRPRNI